MFKNKRRTSVTQGQGSAEQGSRTRNSSDDSFVAVDANLLDSNYARKCAEIMALHSGLSSLGAGDLIALPRVVVIGGQSAGKSSLVEAVSGINVPRDSGTCTRCPMECSMNTSSSRWSCNISLRLDYDHAGNRLSASREDSFGPTLKDKNGMELWLRRAQMAILSPHLPNSTFINKSAEELKAIASTDGKVLKFSRNTVRVTINDPDATSLSFVDLPGLIQNESSDVIDLVRTMVVDMIGGDNSGNTLVLITIPMSDDMENQQAVRLAKEADPTGIRTIGVLTKPDLVGQGAINARENWKSVIQGDAHPLKHGYYCVRLLDDESRMKKLTRAEAQRNETAFFQSTPPWDAINQNGRFGVPAFVRNISELLVEMIEANLPKMKEDVNNLLEDCRKTLIKLPAPVTNEPAAEIMLRVTKFCNDFRSAVYGDKYKKLAQDNRHTYEQYKLNIRRTEPDFRPFVNHNRYIRPTFAVEEDVSPWISSTGKTYGLTDVRSVIKNSIGWELPGHVPFEAVKVLVSDFTSCWREPSLDCFNAVFTHLKETLDHFMAEYFGHFKQLHAFIESVIAEEVASSKENMLSILSKILDMEKGPVFTQNAHYLADAKEKWLGRYIQVHRQASRYIKKKKDAELPKTSEVVNAESDYYAYEEPVDHEQEALRALLNSGYGTLTKEDLSRLLAPGDYKEELDLMAQVRAYFQVAYKRIIDYIPLAIEHELNQALESRLQEKLFQALLKDASRMKELLSEDPDISKRREFLEKRIRRLVEIRQKLENFRQE